MFKGRRDHTDVTSFCTHTRTLLPMSVRLLVQACMFMCCHSSNPILLDDVTVKLIVHNFSNYTKPFAPANKRPTNRQFIFFLKKEQCAKLFHDGNAKLLCNRFNSSIISMNCISVFMACHCKLISKCRKGINFL